MTSPDTAPASFDFGLSEQQEERARRLHRESIVVDLLSQHAGSNIFEDYTPSLQAELQSFLAAAGSPMEAFLRAVYWPYELSKEGRSHLIWDWFQQSGLTCGTYGIGVHDGTDALEKEWQATTQRYADLPWLRFVTTAAEIRAAKRDGLIAFYAHCQPTTPIPRDLNCIDSAYSRGLRSLMLTYNSMDHVGVGCTERVDAGLSNYGVEVVRHCNAVGMIVDVSHCGPLTTMDACRHSSRPVTANHTGAGNFFSHARNKSDEACDCGYGRIDRDRRRARVSDGCDGALDRGLMALLLQPHQGGSASERHAARVSHGPRVRPVLCDARRTRRAII